MWADAWHRMGNNHGFISPARFTYEPGEHGVSITAHWISSASPQPPVTVPQSAQAYAAWLKAADRWRAAVSDYDARRWRGPRAPW